MLCTLNEYLIYKRFDKTGWLLRYSSSGFSLLSGIEKRNEKDYNRRNTIMEKDVIKK